MIIDHNRRSAPSGRKLLGACAGLEHRTGIPANAWRIGLIAALLLVSIKLTLAFYCTAALVLWIGRR